MYIYTYIPIYTKYNYDYHSIRHEVYGACKRVILALLASLLTLLEKNRDPSVNKVTRAGEQSPEEEERRNWL